MANQLCRITLNMCVDNVIGSKNIPRVMMENWGQLCFEKHHSDRLVLHSMLKVFLITAL